MVDFRVWCGALFLTATACGGASPGTPLQIATSRAVGDCSPRTSSLRAVGDGRASRASSGIALAQRDGRTLAIVADEDDHALHVIDVAERKEVATVPLAGIPSQVIVAGDGRVLVTLRDASVVQVFTGDGDSLIARCSVPAPTEPIAIAETADGSFVVTGGWAHELDVLDARDLAVRKRVDLPREPRGVVVANESAVVSHVVGSTMSVVDLRTYAVREIDTHGPAETRRVSVQRTKGAFESRDSTTRRQSIQGYALAMVGGRVVAPRVLVDPGDLDEVPTYYGSDDRPAEIADVLLLDDRLAAVPAKVTRERRSSREDRFGDCQLPRAVAENVADHTALVTCVGSNTLRQYAIEVTPEPRVIPRGTWPVASGPIAVAYDGAHAQAIVWSQFDHAIDFVALPKGSLEDRLVAEKDRVTRLNLARPASLAQNGEIEMGRTLFHTGGDKRISREGLACASCHPDGRDDALTWATSDGPRQVPMLAGRLEGTAPYAWSGTSARVSEHLEHTMQRLGGSGLSEREMQALAAYCMTMKTPAASGMNDAKIAHGKAIFLSASARCSSCHTPDKGVFTDQKKHDVASKTPTDNEAAFDTPSLRFVGGTGPYFHDGRYANLHDLLVGTRGTMGQAPTAAQDLDALEAYLRTL